MANTAWKTGLTAVSTTLADHGAAIKTGQTRYENGNKYILVEASEGIPDGYACSIDQSASEADDGISVVKTSATAASSGVLCFNNVGAALTDGQYFWGLVEGVGYGYQDTAATIAGAGEDLAVEGTAGELSDRVDSFVCAVSLEASTADTTLAIMAAGRLDHVQVA
jgi:hypothetical protein